MKNLNELSKEVHKNAVGKGFWDTHKSSFHCIMLAITELSEAIEADRKNKHSDILKFEEEIEIDHVFKIGKVYDSMFKNAFEEYIKGSVEEEIADAFIRLLDLAGERDMKLFVETKIIKEFKIGTHGWSFCELIYFICKGLLDSAQYTSRQESIRLTLTRLYVISDLLSFDLDKHVEYKMQYNSTRERMHGKLY